MIVNCTYCNIEFKKPACHVKRVKNVFCSKKCCDIYKVENGTYAGENNPAFKGNKIPRVCDICKNTYLKRKPTCNNSGTNICSDNCRAEYYKTAFVGENNPHWEPDRNTLKLRRKFKLKAAKAIRRKAGSISKKDVAEIYKAQNGNCFYCSAPVSTKFHLDHFIPISKGGETIKENLVVACPFCNLSKNNKHPDEFIRKGKIL